MLPSHASQSGPSLEAAYRPLLEAVSLAARVHQHQLRKDGRTPYVGHVFRACLIVRHVFGVDDPQVLLAALLHDAIEDTSTDYDDLHEAFGSTYPALAGWVRSLSKDKRLPEEERERDYCAGLATAPAEVKLCKLADIFDNLMDSTHLDASRRAKVRQRSHQYLQVLRTAGDDDRVQRAAAIVTRLLDETGSHEA